MPTRRSAAVAVLAFSLATLLAPSVASAYERQWHLGGSFGYGLLAQDETVHGLGGGVHLAYGLTDAFNAMVHVDVTTFPSSDLIVASGAAGAGYVIDILEWVPYVGLLAGVYQVSFFGDVCDDPNVDCASTRFGVSIPFGLDYLLSRSFALGVQGRYHLLIGGDGTASYLTAVARAEYIWGF